MTDAQCNQCAHAGFINYPDGDMFDCGRGDDPRMPFDMEHDTVCPCFERKSEYITHQMVIGVIRRPWAVSE